jgi:hypothetical protein
MQILGLHRQCQNGLGHHGRCQQLIDSNFAGPKSGHVSN